MPGKQRKNVIVSGLVREAEGGKADAIEALQKTAGSNAPAAREAAAALEKLGIPLEPEAEPEA
jgi:hypothetical protein